MRRRDFIKLIGVTAASPVVARAQTVTKIFRLASLTLVGPLPGVYGPTLMRALGERGYIQGQNLELHPFGSAGMPLSRLTQFAQDIAATKFDAAVVAGRLSDKAGGRGLRKEGADADQHHAGQDCGQMSRQ